jgi:hypothetical protein
MVAEWKEVQKVWLVLGKRFKLDGWCLEIERKEKNPNAFLAQETVVSARRPALLDHCKQRETLQNGWLVNGKRFKKYGW